VILASWRLPAREAIESVVRTWWDRKAGTSPSIKKDVEGSTNSYIRICRPVFVNTGNYIQTRVPDLFRGSPRSIHARLRLRLDFENRPHYFGVYSCHLVLPTRQPLFFSKLSHQAHVFKILTIGTPYFSSFTQLRSYFCRCGFHCCQGSHDII
jgi:hypothetical protein